MSGCNKLTRIGTGMMALLLLLGTMTLTGCGVGGSGGTSVASAGAGEQAESAYAIYPHFEDQKVTEKNHTLSLANSKKNNYAFVYQLAANGTTLYESKKIQPGEKESWDISANCTESCALDITITAWSLEDDQEQNSVTQTIQLTLPEASTKSA